MIIIPVLQYASEAVRRCRILLNAYFPFLHATAAAGKDSGSQLSNVSGSKPGSLV